MSVTKKTKMVETRPTPDQVETLWTAVAPARRPHLLLVIASKSADELRDIVHEARRERTEPAIQALAERFATSFSSESTATESTASID